MTTITRYQKGGFKIESDTTFQTVVVYPPSCDLQEENEFLEDLVIKLLKTEL